MDSHSVISRTILSYHEDMWCLKSQSTLIGIILDEERNKHALAMESTIFHHSGSGQGSDTGSITSCDGDDDFKFKFAVQDVRRDDHGILELKPEVVVLEDGIDVKGKKVVLEVPEARRKLNSRLHSAGHLLDACTEAIGLWQHLQPTKGYHPREGLYVEYEGTIPETEKSSKLQEIETEANALISRGGTVSITVVPYEQASEVCGGNLPASITKGSTSCVVKLGTLPVVVRMLTMSQRF